MSFLVVFDRTNQSRRNSLHWAGLLVIAAGLLWAVWRFGLQPGPAEAPPADLETYRARLQEQVAAGRLSAAEAQVRFAEAMARAGKARRWQSAKQSGSAGGGKDGQDGKGLPPELVQLGVRLKEQLGRGELTAEEAAARWKEALAKAGVPAPGKRAGAGPGPADKKAGSSAKQNADSSPAKQP